MSSKCFVPNCKNTVGVPFPKEPELKKKWLDALKIKHVNPNLSSFLCLDHFADSDLNDETGSVKEGATPSIISLKKNDTTKEYNCEEEGLQNVEKQMEVDTVTSKDVDIEDNSTFDESECETIQENNSEVNDGEVIINTIEHQVDESDKAVKDEIEIVMFNVDTNTCRLCANEETNTKNIFKEKIENVPVSVAIMECIYPVEISEDDKLSKEICYNCLKTLTSYFKFRSICLENDKRQRDLYNEDEHQMEEATFAQKTTENKEKRKANMDTCTVSNKKKRVVEEVLTDSENSYDEEDELESLSDFLVKKEVNMPDPLQNKSSSCTSESPPPLIPLQSHVPVPPKQSQADIDKKFDKVEEELRRVLEGQLTEEQAMAENIIIHVENDDEDQSPDKVATLSRLKLPIVIKPLESKKSGKNVPLIISRRRIIEGDAKDSMKLKTTDTNEVTLPKGINVTVKDNFKSFVGTFEGTTLSYVFDTEFCQVDGYLYEYRLCKGNVRYLRCVLPACQALALQNRIKTGIYNNEVTVEKPHTHRRPSLPEKKKQMFYYVMKRRMQSDKTLNFRSVYDEVCKHDPEIKDLVPLRNVINEICRHQLTYKIPLINSFEQFYNHIEDDAFQKLHFTHNGRQFYQEKFTADDDSKAIVFANVDIIEQVSYSNLMYVDASFKIDTNEDFKYQLVTVLVWVDDSYYPALYALVNRKSQEIYKKIFEYLHDSLAPKLHPEEIVTDYEANLYYALGETYLDSSIGGSVFYYTQNLYKKMCTLNLSRDLETNSYFRNIYHMLLMLPLLPVNTILDGLNNMEIQARDLGLTDLTRAIFDHVRTEWIMKVTPDLFCVHRLENRINENVIAPFKKLRDFIMLSKGKMQKQHTSIITVVEKLIELEHFLQITYSAPNKKSFARDLSSSQKKNVLKAWQYIESHPKININNFFSKVLGYIKCMENQLWIWGFYRYDGDVTDDLINATNFSIVSSDVEVVAQGEGAEQADSEEEELIKEEGEQDQVVMEAVIDENGGFVLQNNEIEEQTTPFENAFLKYVYKE